MPSRLHSLAHQCSAWVRVSSGRLVSRRAISSRAWSRAWAAGSENAATSVMVSIVALALLLAGPSTSVGGFGYVGRIVATMPRVSNICLILVGMDASALEVLRRSLVMAPAEGRATGLSNRDASVLVARLQELEAFRSGVEGLLASVSVSRHNSQLRSVVAELAALVRALDCP